MITHLHAAEYIDRKLYCFSISSFFNHFSLDDTTRHCEVSCPANNCPLAFFLNGCSQYLKGGPFGPSQPKTPCVMKTI
jgi:hypothetical protein